MTKKSISQKRADRAREEDRVLNRVFVAFLTGLILEVYLLVVYRGFVSTAASHVLGWYTALRILTWAGLALLVLGAAAAYWKREDKRLRRILLCAAGAGLFFFVSGLVMTKIYPRGVTAMCVLVPVLMLLAIIYLLFQHECALSTAALAGGLFTVWLLSASTTSQLRAAVIVGSVLAELLLILAAGLTLRARADGGKLKKARVFSVECDYRIVLAVLGATFLCVLAALIAPAAGYYLMWVLGVLLFLELAYYTMKLM